MPQYSQSSQNPFSGSPRGGNYEYWRSTQGLPPAPIGGTVRGQAAGPQSLQGMAQNSAAAGLQASQNPVMPGQPPPLPMPQLPQPMGLQEILGLMPGYSPLGTYGAGAWQLPAYASAGGAPTPQTPGPAAPQTPPQISTGITQPQFGGPAGAPQMPIPHRLGEVRRMSTAPQWAGGGDAASGAYAQAIQPLVSQLGGQYYQQAAPLQLGAQQAQSQAGLGWAGLWDALQQQQGMGQQQQFSDIVRALGGFV